MREIILEGTTIKSRSTQDITLEDLKRQFKGLKDRIQRAKDELTKAQDMFIAFKGLLTQANIDFKDF